MVTFRQGTEIIGELPGEGPWSVARYGAILVFVSPNSEPMIVRDGKIEPLGPLPASEAQEFAVDPKWWGGKNYRG